MKSKRMIVSLSVGAVIVLLSVCMMISSVMNGYDYKNNSKIYENIGNLDFLDEYIVEENIKRKDKNIKQFEEGILDCKNVIVEYDGSKIYIHSYIFKSSESCLDYVRAVNGNDYEELYIKNDGKLSMYYYKHISFLNIYQSEKLLVFSNEKAYVISAKIPEKDFNHFIEYFMEQLPLEVQMTF